MPSLDWDLTFPGDDHVANGPNHRRDRIAALSQGLIPYIARPPHDPRTIVSGGRPASILSADVAETKKGSVKTVYQDWYDWSHDVRVSSGQDRPGHSGKGDNNDDNEFIPIDSVRLDRNPTNWPLGSEIHNLALVDLTGEPDGSDRNESRRSPTTSQDAAGPTTSNVDGNEPSGIEQPEQTAKATSWTEMTTSQEIEAMQQKPPTKEVHGNGTGNLTKSEAESVGSNGKDSTSDGALSAPYSIDLIDRPANQSAAGRADFQPHQEANKDRKTGPTNLDTGARPATEERVNNPQRQHSSSVSDFVSIITVDKKRSGSSHTDAGLKRASITTASPPLDPRLDEGGAAKVGPGPVETEDNHFAVERLLRKVTIPHGQEAGAVDFQKRGNVV